MSETKKVYSTHKVDKTEFIVDAVLVSFLPFAQAPGVCARVALFGCKLLWNEELIRK